jgi:RimJ/RimL family protein N-acetyltransferase
MLCGMDDPSSRSGRLPCLRTLPDGTALTIRELHASDEPALREWFATLSPESRYQRFHNPAGDLSTAQWRYLTRVDHKNHIAIIALVDGQLVGVARMIRLDNDRAELAFLVDDDLQRRGVGTALRDVLIAQARKRRYDTLCAYVLRENAAIRRLLAGANAPMNDRGDVIELALRTG